MKLNVKRNLFIQRNLFSTITNEAAINLKNVLGNRFSLSKAVRDQHGKDESYHDVAPPDAVAFVETTSEIQEIARICANYKIPMIPFGAGSSLEGNIGAVRGGLSIDMTKMNNVLELDQEDMTVTVQAGVLRLQLESYLRGTGLFFPVDPGADASIGGMVSTNASGTTTLKYGNMKQNVCGLTIVLPDGKIIKTGTKARKSSAGYDLTRLFIGSEGTLGIITEATLRLHGIPASESTLIISFNNIKETIDCCTNLIQMGVNLARLELMDENTEKAVHVFNNPGKSEGTNERTVFLPSLIIELHGSDDNEIKSQINVINDVLEIYNVKNIKWAHDGDERRKIWKQRHNAWYSVLRMLPGSQGLTTDVCVPISRLSDVITKTQQDLKDNKILGNIVGHVGDGNFHVFIPFFKENKEEMKKIFSFCDRLVERALQNGGTCTGEHGIGTGKKIYLRKEYDENTIETMLKIKKTFDPMNIMNPGKIF